MAAGALMVIETDSFSMSSPVEQLPHVVDRVHGHAQPAHFAEGARVVAVEAHQRGQVERGAQAGLAFVDQELESLVRLPRGAKAGKLPHRPQPPAIHRGVYAAGIRILTRVAQLGVVVELAEVLGRVERIDLGAADRRGRQRRRRRAIDFLLPTSPKLTVHGSSHRRESSKRDEKTATSRSPKTAATRMVSLVYGGKPGVTSWAVLPAIVGR